MLNNSLLRRILITVTLLSLFAMPVFAASMKVNLKTSMSGASFNGAVPSGRVEYELESSSRKLAFELRNIVLPAGTVVTVFANGVQVGTVTVRNHGGTLLRSTFANQSVPSLSVGSTLAVRWGTTTLMVGHF